jgi:hypothetical protein
VASTLKHLLAESVGTSHRRAGRVSSRVFHWLEDFDRVCQEVESNGFFIHPFWSCPPLPAFSGQTPATRQLDSRAPHSTMHDTLRAVAPRALADLGVVPCPLHSRNVLSAGQRGPGKPGGLVFPETHTFLALAGTGMETQGTQFVHTSGNPSGPPAGLGTKTSST